MDGFVPTAIVPLKDRGRDCILFRWRSAVCSESGPPSTTRLVLLAISLHMGMDGAGAYPNQETLARESGLGLRAVKDHLQYAADAGWINRTPRRKGAKRSYRFGTEYLPRFPSPGFDGATRPLPPGRERRRIKREERDRNSAPGANDGAPGTTMVYPAATSTSKNSSRKSSCL